VSASTQEIMIQECRRAAEVVGLIFDEGMSWSALFEKHDFFNRYRYYIQVVAAANNPENMKKWAGTVESKIRQLVLKLEFVDSLKLAHPFIKGFERTSHCISEEEVNDVAFNKISDTVANRTEEESKKSEFHRTVYTTTFYIGLAIQPKQPGSVGPQKLDITYPTNEFKRLAKSWEHFDLGVMDLNVTHIKNAQLPNWVFEGGVRPLPKGTKRTKPTKTSPSINPSELPNKKRRSSLNNGVSVTPTALMSSIQANQ